MATQHVVTTSEKVLWAAADLLQKGGIDAVSTRAVAAAAGVQPPAIYRQFGDKDGLLDAVTTFVLQNYLHQKRRLLTASDDPVNHLRRLWDLHVQFGLAQPDCYVLTYGQARPGRTVPAADESYSLLREATSRAGEHGLLKTTAERGASFMHACGVGFVLTQLTIPEQERDPKLNEFAREHALAAILNEPKRKAPQSHDLPGRAVALGEAIRDDRGDVPLTVAERRLLREWLDRLADQD
jgi:AcrR family transcriptional regulator